MTDRESYQAAGVHYDILDAGKRAAILAALSTSSYAATRGVSVDDDSRGEPAFTFQIGGVHLALVMECLGTKSSIAADVQATLGVDHFADVGYDTVSAIVNDVCSVGALPSVVTAYFATGTPSWYEVSGRFESLVEGWRQACEDSEAVWGGGESPMLGGIVADGEIDLAGSSLGSFPAGRGPLLGSRLSAGDEIVLIESNGLHTNGASFARRTAERAGYDATLSSGETFGEAVLSRSHIYARLIRRVYDAGLPLTYAAHITGHGLRKLMRPERALRYRISSLPPVPALFSFMSDTLDLDTRTAYSTFNMGAGFALYGAPGSSDALIEAAQAVGFDAWRAGVVEEGPRSVVLEPLGVTFESNDLQLR